MKKKIELKVYIQKIETLYLDKFIAGCWSLAQTLFHASVHTYTNAIFATLIVELISSLCNCRTHFHVCTHLCYMLNVTHVGVLIYVIC